MPRYIDADALYKEIEQYKAKAQEEVKNAYGMSRRMIATTKLSERDTFAGLVRWMPTADVAEVRHGYWKKVSGKYPRYVCTACNHLFNNHGYKYCPNCGAKMAQKGSNNEK